MLKKYAWEVLINSEEGSEVAVYRVWLEDYGNVRGEARRKSVGLGDLGIFGKGHENNKL